MKTEMTEYKPDIHWYAWAAAIVGLLGLGYIFGPLAIWLQYLDNIDRKKYDKRRNYLPMIVGTFALILSARVWL